MRYKACTGVVKAGSTPSVVGHVTSWTLDAQANIKKFFELGNCSEQSEAGGVSRTVSIEANFDPDDVGQGALIDVGESVDLEIYPIGETSGSIYYDMTGVVESASQSGSGDDFITVSMSISVNSYVEGSAV